MRRIVMALAVSAGVGAACADVAPPTGLADLEPRFAPGACSAYSCTIGDCGYDPATDPRGACCVELVEDSGNPEVDEPSCEYSGGGDPNDPYAGCMAADNQCYENTVTGCRWMDPGESCPAWCPPDSPCVLDPVDSFNCEMQSPSSCWS